MKKSIITIAAFVLCIGYGVLSWDLITHSETASPEDSPYAAACSFSNESDRAFTTTDYNSCCIEYNEALDAAKRDWQTNLQQLIDQEKAASDMVADGYDSLRTYNCWVEYICLAVLYSGHAPIESAMGTGLTSEHLGTVPGCQDPEDLKMESEYNQYMETLKDVPIIGLPIGAIDDAFVTNKINFFPSCMTDMQNNQQPSLVDAKANYDACKRAMEINFGCPEGVDETICPDSSNAFVTLENALKKTNGDQKSAALERKLGTIIPKMHTMEEHVNYLARFLNQLDLRFSCYAAKCD